MSAKQRIAHKMAFAWIAYSKPCPSNACEMLTLVLLCVLISSTISALLFVWMMFSLDYDPSMAGIVSAVCAFVMPVLLILVHPVRCVITITVPTLSTKQGRKIILSTALLYAITSCIPNINHNMSCSLHMLKCSTGNITHGVLESIWVPRKALKDIKHTLSILPSFKNTEYSFSLDDNNVDVTDMMKKLSQTSDSIRAELGQVLSRMAQISRVLKKIIAALFVLLLISSSVAYGYGYLTHIKHDNVYQSHQLMEALQKVSCDVTLPKSYKKTLVKTSGVRMSARELKRSLWGLLGLFIHALVCGIMIGLDHFVYQSLQSLLSWASDIPEIRGTVHVSMTVSTTQTILTNFMKSSGCVPAESKTLLRCISTGGQGQKMAHEGVNQQSSVQ